MINYHIYIEPSINETHRNLCEDYWQIENDKVISKVSDLIIKYSLSQSEIGKIVKKYSYGLIKEKCTDCDIIIERKYTVKTDFNLGYGDKKCKKCWDKLARENKRKREARFQEIKEREEQHNINLENAITEKRWLQLSNEELEVLQEIINKGTVSKINENIFNSRVYDDFFIWTTVAKLETLGIIAVKVSRKPGMNFEFRSELRQLIDFPKNDKPMDYPMSLNIFQIWDRFGRKTPFAVRNDNWSEDFYAIVESIECENMPYGKAIGYPTYRGQPTTHWNSNPKWRSEKLIPCCGCYQWTLVSDPDLLKYKDGIKATEKTSKKASTIDSKFFYGKYKGMTVADVYNKNPGYIEWSILNVEKFFLTFDALEYLDTLLSDFKFNDETRRLNNEKLSKDDNIKTVGNIHVEISKQMDEK